MGLNGNMWNNILYCVDGEDKYANKFRYSQDQRRKETKSKKYSKIILELKNKYIEGKIIIEYETELSKYNRKTLDFNNFLEYKRSISSILNIRIN